MPTVFAHAAAGIAAASILAPSDTPRRFWVAAAVCGALPDIDSLGRPFGFSGWDNMLGGHRGFTHSLFFAVLAAAAIAAWRVRDARWEGSPLRLWLCLALAVASHGFLDCFTTYGSGVALLAPFSWQRFTAPWHPLGAIGGRMSIPVRMSTLMGNEVMWVGLPSSLILLVHLYRRRRSQ